MVTIVTKTPTTWLARLHIWWLFLRYIKYLFHHINLTGVCVYLRDPEGAADVGPLGPAARGLHGSAPLGTQLAARGQTQRTRPAQPAALGNLLDPVARLGTQHTTL